MNAPSLLNKIQMAGTQPFFFKYTDKLKFLIESAGSPAIFVLGSWVVYEIGIRSN